MLRGIDRQSGSVGSIGRQMRGGMKPPPLFFVFLGLLFGSRTKGILEGVGKGLK